MPNFTEELAVRVPENILHPVTAEDFHQRNYVIASGYSVGHHIQAAEIHDAGFLNANDPVAISFWIISIAMIATTTFLWMESLVVKTNWKTALHIASLVTCIAAVHYLYMREFWVKFQQSPMVYRYIDWSITVPLQMSEFFLILSAVNPNISGGIFGRLMIGTMTMLTAGYLGESGNMNPLLAFCLAMAGWGFILFEVFFGEAGRMAQKAEKMNGFVKNSYNTMRLIVTVGWSIYFVGYLFRQWGDSSLNFTYNMADFVNRIFFCLAIWHAGKTDTIESLGRYH